MGVDYDAWLEKPYQDAYAEQDAWDDAEESFRKDGYHEAFDEWAEKPENAGKTAEEWERTDDYEKSVTYHMHALAERWR